MLVPPATENPQTERVPRLLVELPSRRRAFFGNLRALILPSSPFKIQSAPAAFWPDVFVRRRFPWNGFLQSGVYHGIAYLLLVAFTRLFAMQPRVVPEPKFDHSEVVYYQPSEYLPPIDTREPSASEPKRADPEFSRQPIISVPPEADNRSQTIVTPPKVRLKRDVALPNMVAWSDEEKKPRLAIPDAPLTPAAEITRMAPRLQNSVVTPPPDAARLSDRRQALALQNSVVAPPPELRAANVSSSFQGLQPALIAPPPTVEVASTRPRGDLNIAPSSVIAPAPQLPVAAQRSLAGGRLGPGTGAAQVVPPPPPVSGGASAGASYGSRGRVIALSLHPTVGAPPEPPAGNRRGTFAATPEGHTGASGEPGSRSAKSGSGETAGGKTSAGALPSGLYVGKTPEKVSPVAGTPAGNQPASSVNPNLLANARPPRVSTTPARATDNAAKLSEPERAVFSGRKFYSLTLNMPNLNSAGGSWVVHFAEAKSDFARDGSVSAADISQPTATRKVDPAYPLQLMRENVAGTVILYAVIHADGTVGNVRVLRGVDERLDRFASDAVAQWKFEPATKNGVPVDVEATFEIPFRPSRVGTSF
jgi:TonB family protein